MKAKQKEELKSKDLSVEKRNELFIKAYQEFEKEASEKYGMRIGAQLAYSQQGIVPRLVTLDLLAKNENQNKAN